ncbi:hypothetical protein B0J14DRAFT_567008 [Halenospora varia]|nr:hypothetical protein B0J14DRAFT_567008 [Halenospora varia]
MSFPDYYDGGSVEIGPSSPPNSVISGCQEVSGDSEYVYVKYRIANKRLSSMEDDIIQMKATIDNYATAIQNETQFLMEKQHRSQTEHLLTVIEQLQMKIQNMREQHSGALCVAADHVARTEKALERLQMTCPENRNPVISE